MPLSTAQLQTLKTYIANDATLSAFPNEPNGAIQIAELLNAPASPAFTVWRSLVTMDEIHAGSFKWNDVDGLTAAKYRTWDLMVNLGKINPSKNTVRQGITDCWGVGSANEANVLAVCKRLATVAEKIFANVSGGNGADATPARLTFEGQISYIDVQDARNS